MKTVLGIFFIVLILFACEDKSNEENGSSQFNDSLYKRSGLIVADAYNQIWIASPSGLKMYAENQLVTVDFGLNDPQIHSLYIENDSLWVGTNEGLWQLAIGKGTYKSVINQYLATSGQLRNDTVLSVCKDYTGALWVGNLKGISMKKNNTWKSNKQIVLNLINVSGYPVTSIAALKDNVFFSSHGKNLFHISYGEELDAISGASQMIGGEETSNENSNYNGKFTTDTIFFVAPGKNGFVWFGSPKGLTRNKGLTHAGFPGAIFEYFLEGMQIFCIGELQGSSTWAGTNKGIFIYNGKSWNEATSINNEMSGKILDIYEDNKSVIWILTNKAFYRCKDLNVEKILEL